MKAQELGDKVAAVRAAVDELAASIDAAVAKTLPGKPTEESAVRDTLVGAKAAKHCLRIQGLLDIFKGYPARAGGALAARRERKPG